MLDASAVVDLILDIRPYSEVISQRIIGEARALYAPYLLDVEVGQVLRRWVLREQLSVDRALVAMEDFWALPICRYPHRPLLERAFGLRDNVTIYDALYVVLAEGLDAPLLTRDQALANIPGTFAKIELIPN
ncbi:MAG: type II toxin-antitoxin system VapC family toxin [Gammaproteobacteria bacterium]